jgi:alpha-L-fucosidase
MSIPHDSIKLRTAIFITSIALSASVPAQEPMQGAELASELKSSIVFKSQDSLKDASIKLPAADMQWWRDAKFGMFIHWGLYSIPARGEWVMHNEKIPADAYAKLAGEFTP